MKQEIIESVYELVDEIKSKEAYKRLLELRKVVDNDSEISVLIEQFQHWNTTYDELKKYGKYHPDLKRVQQSFTTAKIALYEHPIVAEYKRLENELQQELNRISASIASSVTTKIKHPNEIGLMQKY